MSKQLEDRFERFALDVRDFCKEIKWDIINIQYIRQVVRLSSSIAANYIEASDDLGKQDEKMKIKISRREAKETIYWLGLVLLYGDKNLEFKQSKLIDEGNQIRKILSAILIKLN